MLRRRRYQDSQQACNAHSPHRHSGHQPSVALDTRPGPTFDGPNC
eukprot:gene12921-biopygen454